MDILDTCSMDENFNYLFLKLRNTNEDHNYDDIAGFQKMVRLTEESIDEENSQNQTESIFDNLSNSRNRHEENDKATITISRSAICPGSKPSVAIIYPCYLCNYETYRSTSLVTHLRQHRQGTLTLEAERFQIGKFVCNICNFKTRWLSSLKEHEQKVHFNDIENEIYYNSIANVNNLSDGPYNCKQCGYTFEELYKLGIHMRRHFRTNNVFGKIIYQYPCALCEYITEELDELENHFNIIHCNGILTDRKFLTEIPTTRNICTKCDYIFTDSDDMILHLQNHDENDIQEFPCDYCSHRSTSIQLWRDHMESHGGVLEISLASVQH